MALVLGGTLVFAILSAHPPATYFLGMLLVLMPWLCVASMPLLFQSSEFMRSGVVAMAWFVWLLHGFVTLVASRDSSHQVDVHDRMATQLRRLNASTSAQRLDTLMTSTLTPETSTTYYWLWGVLVSSLSIVATLSRRHAVLKRLAKPTFWLYALSTLALPSPFAYSLWLPILRVAAFLGVSVAMTALCSDQVIQLTIYFLEIYYALVAPLLLVPFVLVVQVFALRAPTKAAAAAEQAAPTSSRLAKVEDEVSESDSDSEKETTVVGMPPSVQRHAPEEPHENEHQKRNERGHMLSAAHAFFNKI